MVRLTKEQRTAVFQLFQRDFPSWHTPFQNKYGRVPSTQYRRFRERVLPYFDGSGCVMIQWKGMWVGIEIDGYTHT